MERASKCDLGGEDFISPSEFNPHMESEPEEPGCTPQKTFICSMCDHAFGLKQHLVRHMRTHTGERPFKCTEDGCEMAFKQKSNLKRHIKGKHNNERPLKCNLSGCHYGAKTSADLLKHKKLHSDAHPFACPQCDFKATRKDDLKKHRMRCHAGNRDFKCSHPQCIKSFKSSFELKLHFRKRHEERNAKCDHPGCGKKYANADALKTHKRDFHSTKSLLCPNNDCSYRTNKKWSLASHMMVHDGRNEKISCSIDGCQYKGKNSRALEKHMRLHRNGLLCPEPGCGHCAATKAALENHLKLHNSSGRPFECPLCSKYYTRLRELQMHCFAHTNEKPFACGHCEYAAARQSFVKKHISSAHAKVKFPFIIHLLDDRECIDCNVILPTAEFLRHCEGHGDRTVLEA